MTKTAKILKLFLDAELIQFDDHLPTDTIYIPEEVALDGLVLEIPKDVSNARPLIQFTEQDLERTTIPGPNVLAMTDNKNREWNVRFFKMTRIEFKAMFDEEEEE